MYPAPVIRLTRPVLDEREVKAVEAVLSTGMLVQGRTVQRFEAGIAERCGRAHAVAVSTGTSALQLALEAIGVGAGDEVLCPDLTWPSPAHAAMLLGATPRLVDVDPHEWNATDAGLAAARRERTAAAIVIDQFGVPARGRAIEEALPDLPIVEDAACAIGSAFAGGRPCGALGVVSCLSFHPRKVLTTGEGGMCLTDDAEVAARLRVLRDHGRDGRGGFDRAAGNHRMTEIAAAIGIVQLDRLDSMIARRRALAAEYRRRLPWLSFQRAPAGSAPNEQTLGALLPEGADRDAIIDGLRERGVEAGILSFALHRVGSLGRAAAAARDEGRRFEGAEAIVDQGVALPLHPGMTEVDVRTVTEALEEVVR